MAETEPQTETTTPEATQKRDRGSGRFVRLRDTEAVNKFKADIRSRLLEVAPIIKSTDLDAMLATISTRKLLVLDLMSNPMQRVTLEDAATMARIEKQTLDKWVHSKEFAYLSNLLARWHIDHELAPIFFDVLIEILTKRENGKLIRDSALVKALDLCADKINFIPPKAKENPEDEDRKEDEKRIIIEMWKRDDQSREALLKLHEARRKAIPETGEQIIDAEATEIPDGETETN